MARRTISYDGVSLQSATYRSQEFEHESTDYKQVNDARFGNRDGSKIYDISFAPRKITVRGIITGANIDTLEANIDALQELLNRTEKNLDVQYASGTRRYKATCRSLSIVRRAFNITFVPFEAEFIVGNPPFGTGLDTATAEFSGVGTSFGTFYGTMAATGTRRPVPTIRMNINGGSGITSASFTNRTTGGTISVTPVGGFTAGDVLIIDTDNFTVTLNGVAIDYVGFFPEFAQGNNDIKRVISSVWHSVDLFVIYRPLYL